ncbi:oligoribonuclease [Neisseria sp. Ec49-e6-T10]|uniref:oligoribonuclease n=1 Tax=Neisseria sp. Ec49-e6-T10 TaxID=3140744 RepID=UPI003EBF35B5
MQDQNNLVWLDMEMTGLNPDTDKIIEVAMIITDKDLNILAQSPVYVVHQSDDILNNMDAWNTATHTRTGLVEKVKASTYSENDVETALIEFMQQWVPERMAPMCGNTIHQDRRFMVRWMPKLEQYFHYRNIDVSTLKELAKRWKPEICKGISKKGAHQALDDIIESIEEMKYYREHFLNLSHSD